MNKLPETKSMPDVENTIRIGSEPVIGWTDKNSKDNSTKKLHDLSTTIRNVNKVIQKGKSKVEKKSNSKAIIKKPKAVAVDNPLALKTPAPNLNESVKKSQTKKKKTIGKTVASVAKNTIFKLTKTSQVQGNVQKSNTTGSDMKSLVKKGQLPLKPISKLKKTTPILNNLISVVKKLESKKEKPKRILKPILKSDVKAKISKQSESAKPNDNFQQ